MAPATGEIITVTARDAEGLEDALDLSADYGNWTEIGGSATVNGIATPDGWAMDSDLAVDSLGNVYAAFSQRKDADATVSSIGWSYFLWIKRYDAATDTWDEIGSSATLYGASEMGNGRVTMAYVLEMKTFDDDLYVLFKGDANVGPSDTNYQLFMKRWNITTGTWEGLGSAAPSDYVDPAGGDAGGVTMKSEAVRFGDFSIDESTGDVYVMWMEDTVTDGSNDGLYMRVYRAATDTWEEISGSASNDGLTDDPGNKYEYPATACHGGTLFFTYIKKVTSTGDDYGLALGSFDMAAGTFGPEVWLENTGNTASKKPQIGASPVDGRIYVIWYEDTGTEYEVRVKTASATAWSSAAGWDAPGGIAANGIISMPERHLGLGAGAGRRGVPLRRRLGGLEHKGHHRPQRVPDLGPALGRHRPRVEGALPERLLWGRGPRTRRSRTTWPHWRWTRAACPTWPTTPSTTTPPARVPWSGSNADRKIHVKTVR